MKLDPLKCRKTKKEKEKEERRGMASGIGELQKTAEGGKIATSSGSAYIHGSSFAPVLEMDETMVLLYSALTEPI